MTIYQAPEFTRNNDQGGVDNDRHDFGFKYGKPVEGDLIETLLVSSVNEYELTVINDDRFTMSENGLVWSSLPDSNYNSYDFTVVVRAYDKFHLNSYDEFTISFTYGWAAVTACVIQPVPGQDDLFDTEEYAGHAFWIIEATQSLRDYCTNQYGSAGSIQNVYSYGALAPYCNVPWGYYPQHSNLWRLFLTDDGVLRTDSQRITDVDAYATFMIPSVGDYLNGLIETYSVAVQPGTYRIKRSGTIPGHNCVDVTIDVVSACGVALDIDEVNVTSYGYNFIGRAPGPFGVQLVNEYGGSYGTYSIGNARKW